MIKYTNDCILGIESLDEDHKYLFKLLAEVHELLNNDFLLDRHDKIVDIIQQLENYAEEHFSREEKYMEELCDPELFRQRIQHNVFRDKMHTFSFSSINDDEEQRKVLSDIIEYLARWLYGHIISSDILIGKMPPLEAWMIKENPCEFTDEYKTGIDFIDEQHNKLFLIIDKAYSLTKNITETTCDELYSIIDRLTEYSKYHFKEEEAYMQEINYEHLEAQQRAHTAFIEHMKNVQKENFKDEETKHLCELTEYLLGWLVNHILKMDKLIPAK